VRSSSNELHTAATCLVIRLRAGEGREERVMDVDDAVAEPGDERRAQDLHVAREDDEIDLVLLEARLDLSLLALPRLLRHWEVHVLCVVELREIGVIWM